MAVWVSRGSSSRRRGVVGRAGVGDEPEHGPQGPAWEQRRLGGAVGGGAVLEVLGGVERPADVSGVEPVGWKPERGVDGGGGVGAGIDKGVDAGPGGGFVVGSGEAGLGVVNMNGGDPVPA